MQLSLTSPEVRERFLRALAETGFMNRAADAVGISPSAVNQYRARHAEFAAACDAARAGPAVKPEYVRWTPALEEAFLAALAETGNAAAAARRAGVTETNAWRRRGREADFAAAWTRAVQEAAARVEDRLFDGALNGFVTTRVSPGQPPVTITAQRPDAMFKLLALHQARPRTYRTMELTPDVLREARDKFEAALARTAAREHRRYAAAGLPELFGPHWHGLDRVLSTLPAPRVT